MRKAQSLGFFPELMDFTAYGFYGFIGLLVSGFHGRIDLLVFGYVARIPGLFKFKQILLKHIQN